MIKCMYFIDLWTPLSWTKFHFSFHRLTNREKEDREHKKQLLKIARDHEKARELERVQRYRMPQDMKKGEKGNAKSIL